MQPEDLALLIDATLLRPEASEDEVARHCEEAMALRCAAAVVFPARLELCAGILAGSGTAACTTVAFPSGAATRRVVEVEVEEALEGGASEIDMVLPLGLLRDGRHGEVVERVHTAAAAVHEAGGRLKVIVEAALWGSEDLARAARLAADGGADFVKTSTGVYGGPATAQQVRLLRAVLPAEVGVKAAGGIATFEGAMEMVAAGAARIGTSYARAILGGEAPPGRRTSLGHG